MGLIRPPAAFTCLLAYFPRPLAGCFSAPLLSCRDACAQCAEHSPTSPTSTLCSLQPTLTCEAQPLARPTSRPLTAPWRVRIPCPCRLCHAAACALFGRPTRPDLPPLDRLQVSGCSCEAWGLCPGACPAVVYTCAPISAPHLLPPCLRILGPPPSSPVFLRPAHHPPVQSTRRWSSDCPRSCRTSRERLPPAHRSILCHVACMLGPHKAGPRSHQQNPVLLPVSLS